MAEALYEREGASGGIYLYSGICQHVNDLVEPVFIVNGYKRAFYLFHFRTVTLHFRKEDRRHPTT